jgi:hypothetical protein
VPCCIFLYTTAPEACDLPSTHRVYASMGATTQGELVRMVVVPLLVFLPQWRRYTGAGTGGRDHILACPGAAWMG